jgi:type IV secretory pathway protease TraF
MGGKMPISAVSHYRGGAIDRVMPPAKRQKAMSLKYGVIYRLSRFETGPNAGGRLVIVQYPDRAAYDKAQGSFAQDPEYQQMATEIAELATRISRELVTDLGL